MTGASEKKTGASEKQPTFQPITGFDILERLGSGGMGTVFKARQVSLNRVVALKILKKTDLVDQLPLERLRREALVTARMNHPAIVKGIDLGETPRYYYFVMEYVEGPNIKTIIESKGPVPCPRAIALMIELAEALDHAFSNGITHRDIKPSNILVTREGRAKLTDLGLAKGIRDLTVTQDGTTVGTPQYIAPEQARDSSSVDIRSDIYSLGATFYHMVTGRMPFEGETVAQVITSVLYGRTLSPREANPDVTPGADRCISKMMARKQASRYQTPRDLLDDLHKLAASGRGGTGKSADGIGMSWKSSRRERVRLRKLFAWALPAAALLTVLVLFMTGGEGDGDGADPRFERLAILKGEFHRGELLPAAAFARLAAFEGGGEFSLVGAAEPFRKELLVSCEKILGSLVAVDEVQITAALFLGGYDGAALLVEERLLGEAERALGWAAEDFPPEVLAGFDLRFEAVKNALAARVARLRQEAEKRFFEILDDEKLKAARAIADGSFDQAGERIAAIGGGGLDLAVRAISDAAALLFGQEAVDAASFDPGRFVGSALSGRRADRLGQTVRDLEELLGKELDGAVALYRGKVEEAITAGLAAAEPDELSLGLGPIVKAAFEDHAAFRPPLPAGAAFVLPDRGGMEESFRDLFEKLLSEATLSERRRLLLEIESAMRRGDGAEAVLALERVPAGVPPFPDREMVLRWTRWVKTLSRVKERALDALEKYVGLNISLSRKGITFEGELSALDRNSEVLNVKVPGGRPIRVPFSDLDAREILRWADRSFRLDGPERFLYLFFSGERDLAVALLDALDGLEEKAFFRERLSDFDRVERDARERIDEELTLLIERGLNALSNRDLPALSAVVDQLRKKEKSLSAGSVWKERRHDREAISRGFKDLQTTQSFLSRLEGDFSVPVELFEKGRIRVKYPFDFSSELDDMKARGRGFLIEGGVLFYTEEGGGGEIQPIDSRIGLRFGGGFDLSESFSLSFTYKAALKGRGPCLLLVAFFGESFGVRSFADGQYPGQTAAWTGELSKWDDYFFYPDLGGERPRKGRTVPFGFNRGEIYRISLTREGSEILFTVDGEVVLRRTVAGLKGKWCEVKTLKSAVFDDLEIEGRFRGK
jgi:tRNA A-37 threonylcarbamoyl transferase component Bud32